MPYVIVRESYINNSCLVDGLPLNEVRLITEKGGEAQINTQTLDRPVCLNVYVLAAPRLINAVNLCVSNPLVSFLYHTIIVKQSGSQSRDLFPSCARGCVTWRNNTTEV